MFTKNIKFKNFKKQKIFSKVKKDLSNLIKEKSGIISSLKSTYKDDYNQKKILRLKKKLFLN